MREARGHSNQPSSNWKWRHLPCINVQYINMIDKKIRNIGFRWPEKRIPTMGVPHKKKNVFLISHMVSVTGQYYPRYGVIIDPEW